MENTNNKSGADILTGIIVFAAVVMMIVMKTVEIKKETMKMRQQSTITK